MVTTTLTLLAHEKFFYIDFYSKIDFIFDIRICILGVRFVDFSIVKLTAAAYKHPSLYPGYKDNEYSVKSLTFYLGGQDQWNPGIKVCKPPFRG